MVYAKDQWVQLPTKDLYDSQIMMASIGAAKDMYDRGVQEIKDYNKNYSDFYSPIGKDMDWYNKNIIQNSKDYINQLYDNGMDPTRTAEGRAAFLKFSNSIPSGKINELKQSAASAEQYLKSVAESQSKNLYNPDYERYIMGGKTLEGWDTSKDGMWNRQSPAEFQNIHDLTGNWFDKNKPHTLTKEQVEQFGIKYDPRNDYTGIAPEELYGTIKGNQAQFIGGQRGQYEMELAKQQLLNSGIQNPTQDQINKQLADNIYTANYQYVQRPIITPNEYAKSNYEFGHQLQLENIKYQHQRKLVQDEATAGGIGLTPWTQRAIYNTQQIANRAIAGAENIKSNISRIANYWQNFKTRAASIKDKNDRAKWMKSADEHLNWWKEAYNDPYNKKYGLVNYNDLTKTYIPTTRLSDAYNYSDNVTGTGPGLKNAWDRHYYTYAYRPVGGTEEHQNVMNILAGSDKPVRNLSMTNAHLPVDLSSPGLQYTPYRRKSVYPTGNLKSGSLTNTFAKYMSSMGGTGYLVNNNVGVAGIPGSKTHDFQLDVYGKVTVDKDWMDKYFEYANINEDDVKSKMLDDLGIVAYDENSKPKRGKDKYETSTYYQIPVTRTIENKGGYEFSEIDSKIDKGMFGSGEASKLAPNSQNASVTQR